MDQQTPQSQNTPQPQQNAVLEQKLPNKSSKSKIIIGVSLLVVTLLTIVFVFSLNSQTKPKEIVIAPSVTQTQVLTQSLFLNIDQPIDSTLITDGTVTIKGKTLPNLTVALYTDSDENSVDSDDSGTFEGTLKLSSGINTINITVYGQNGEEKTQTLTLVYDSQK